jgi:hypothetical protein
MPDKPKRQRSREIETRLIARLGEIERLGDAVCGVLMTLAPHCARRGVKRRRCPDIDKIGTYAIVDRCHEEGT